MMILEDATSDSDISHINSFVANFVSEFASKYAMFSRRVGMDRFLCIHRLHGTRGIDE